MTAMAILKYRATGSMTLAGLFLAPLFIAHVLIGISSLLFSRNVLGMSGNIFGAIFANSTYATAFAFLVVLAQLARYDWRLDDAATVFGAKPWQTFREVTLPLIWPAMFGAFIVSFLLAFNNLEISFYNLGATPTLPTLAWGSLRHGISEELYALAALINFVVFAALAVLYFLLRAGVIRLDYRTGPREGRPAVSVTGRLPCQSLSKPSRPKPRCWSARAPSFPAACTGTRIASCCGRARRSSSPGARARTSGTRTATATST